MKIVDAKRCTHRGLHNIRQAPPTYITDVFDTQVKVKTENSSTVYHSCFTFTLIYPLLSHRGFKGIRLVEQMKMMCWQAFQQKLQTHTTTDYNLL